MEDATESHKNWKVVRGPDLRSEDKYQNLSAAKMISQMNLVHTERDPIWLPNPFGLTYRTSAIWLPNWSRTRWKMTTEHIKRHRKRQSRQLPRDDHRDLTATDITADVLNMNIDREDYWEPNQTQPLKEMFTESHTEGSGN